MEAEIWQRYKDRGLQVIGIDLWENTETVKSYRDEFKLTYPIWIDKTGSVWSQYGMGYIPHNVVISPDWVVRYTNYGYSKAAIIQTIEQWLPSGVIGEPASSARDFSLSRAYPNPFVPGDNATRVRFRLQVDRPMQLEVAVFDLCGRKVASILAGRTPPGEVVARWDGKDGSGRPLPAGVYLVRAMAGGQVITRRVVLLTP